MRARTLAFAAIVAAGIGVAMGCARAAVPAYVSAAIADPLRGDSAKADARRKPAELMVFAGVKPGDTVVDLIPGSGYFTRIFAKLVGPKGHVYAVWPDKYARVEGDAVEKTQRMAADYPNISILIEPVAQFAVPTKADVVWTSQNYHDYPDKFMGPTDPAILDREVLAALKPGGVFVVVDHAAAAGSGLAATETMHRSDPQFVKAQVIAAGFRFAGESAVLRNPADTHTLLVFDAKIRGHTDQFVLRFRKPTP